MSTNEHQAADNEKCRRAREDVNQMEMTRISIQRWQDAHVMRFQSLNAPPPPPPPHLRWVLVGGRWGGETKGARARRSRDLNPVGHGTGTWPAPFHTQTDNQHKEEWRHTQHTRHAAMDSPKRLILARDFYEPYLQSDPLSAESITLIWLKN